MKSWLQLLLRWLALGWSTFLENSPLVSYLYSQYCSEVDKSSFYVSVQPLRKKWWQVQVGDVPGLPGAPVSSVFGTGCVCVATRLIPKAEASQVGHIPLRRGLGPALGLHVYEPKSRRSFLLLQEKSVNSNVLKLLPIHVFKTDYSHMLLFKLSNRQCKYFTFFNEMVYYRYPIALRNTV